MYAFWGPKPPGRPGLLSGVVRLINSARPAVVQGGVEGVKQAIK
jgi:hypothetical protein